jgi:hypothetical protein
MVADLKESEGRLQVFLPSLAKDLEPKTQETVSGKSVSEVTAAFCCVLFVCHPRHLNKRISSEFKTLLKLCEVKL